MPETIPILILAAGASTRMKGKIKQLLPWGNSTLLEHAVKQASLTSENVYLVLGAHAEDIIKSTSLQVEIIRNTEWEKGMGSSISKGVKHVLNMENPEALLIMLADQPLIDSSYLAELVQKFKSSDNKIVATSYHGRPGVPAIFDKRMFEELLLLNEGFGAKKVMENHKDGLVIMDAVGREMDIDTKENYIQLYSKQ